MVLLSSNDLILKLGSSAPPFRLIEIEGVSYSLEQFKRKKAILILFMCNHCPYVKPKMRFFVDLQKKYEGAGFQLIAINPNDPKNHPEDNAAGMRKTAEENSFNFPYLIDETQEIAKKYGAVCTPDPFLFDSNLKLVYHGRFDDAHGKSHEEATTNELEEAILGILTSREITRKQHPSIGCSIKWR